MIRLWEFDYEAQAIAAWSWRPGAAVDVAVRATGDWIAQELGDFRSFSLDSPDSRRGRIEPLRSLA